jgi:hypothetical protein
MPKVSTALKTFLSNPKVLHNCRELALWYNENMEVQIMAAADNGEPVAEKRNIWSDGTTEWGHIRIPKNADTEPIDNDFDLRWPLHEHVEYIGMTGWDWRNKQSLWIGFDFDAITGHAVGVGVSQEELNRVRTAVEGIPQAWLFRSTSGSGLHLYLRFDPASAPSTANHHEHAALARACLGVLSNISGFNFGGSLDVCGSNMWIWGRKMTQQNNGLSLIKRGEGYFDPPLHWRDHVDVIARKRTKVQIKGVGAEDESDVENMAASRRVVPLDAAHRQIIEELQKLPYTTYWVADHNLLQTHTRALAEVAKIFADRGDPLQGHFATLSDGKDPGKPNAFCFPCPSGAFKVVRFGVKTPEDVSWGVDSKGWRYCYFNRKLDLRLASSTFNGAEDTSRGGGFSFQSARDALDAIKALGATFNVPEPLVGKPTRLREHKDGRVIVEIECKADEYANLNMPGFVKKGNKVTRVLDVQATPPEIQEEDTDLDITKLDQTIRMLLTTGYDEAGWALHDIEMIRWAHLSKDNIRSALKAKNFDPDVVEKILGHAILKAWTLVNIPFAPEYPGNRQWNHEAAQLRFKPAEVSEDKPPVHPHWDLVLSHCGGNIDESLKGEEWAKRAGIRDGRDYLLYWIATMIRHPFEPLPYLFFFGPQNSGKSIYHEAISLLIVNGKGVVPADHALTNSSSFNGELANAVLCVVEETDLSQAAAMVYDRIKNWVTGLEIAIHPKRMQVYSQKNTTHWVQCANDRSACPIFPGDTRITMFHVPELEHEIPKDRLLSALEEEAPQFMATIMSLNLPNAEHRMRIPAVSTSDKEQAESSNRDPLQQYIADICHYAPGEYLSFKDFYDTFAESLTALDRNSWNKRKVRQEMPSCYPIGGHTGNRLCVGNISYSVPDGKSVHRFAAKGDKLLLEPLT